MTNTININTLVREINADDDGIQLVYTVTAQNGVWLTLTTDDGIEAKARKGEIFGDNPAYEIITLDDLADIEDEEAEDEEATSKMSKQLERYRKGYVPTIAASGRKSLSNGDDLAQALETYPLDALYATVADIFEIDLQTQYAHLNLGSQRMNLGNRMRAAFNKVEHPKHDLVGQWVKARLETINS